MKGQEQCGVQDDVELRLLSWTSRKERVEGLEKCGVQDDVELRLSGKIRKVRVKGQEKCGVEEVLSGTSRKVESRKPRKVGVGSR